ncbi:MAG: tetratricopeptide repeat protein [Gaiellaceae bacterium]
MTRTRMLVIAGAVVATAAVLLLGGSLRTGSPALASSAVPAGVAEELQRGFSTGDTAATLAGLQAELGADPGNARDWSTLGLAYQQRARETGDPTYYGKAEGALRRALSLHPHDLVATAGLGQLALSRHRFREALALGLEAKRISATTAGVYGVIGDAEIELGRYRQAFRDFDRMVSIKPSVSSLARVSYARELLGRVGPALQAMELAASAATGDREAWAWTHAQHGLLNLSVGRARAAQREAREALTIFPGYYLALDAMAQSQAALGRLQTATAYERQAVNAIPLPQYVAFLGDLERVTGHGREARQEYALIGAIERLLAANGVRNDLDIAQFDVDHGIRLGHALRLARLGRRERPSILGDDVLAWALARNGQCTAALHYSQRALRLGTRDAVRFFHRGWIEQCLGNHSAADLWYRRALALNPHFSLLWAPVARKELAS